MIEEISIEPQLIPITETLTINGQEHEIVFYDTGYDFIEDDNAEAIELGENKSTNDNESEAYVGMLKNFLTKWFFVDDILDPEERRSWIKTLARENQNKYKNSRVKGNALSIISPIPVAIKEIIQEKNIALSEQQAQLLELAINQASEVVREAHSQEVEGQEYEEALVKARQITEEEAMQTTFTAEKPEEDFIKLGEQQIATAIKATQLAVDLLANFFGIKAVPKMRRDLVENLIGGKILL